MDMKHIQKRNTLQEMQSNFLPYESIKMTKYLHYNKYALHLKNIYRSSEVQVFIWKIGN